MHFGATLRLLRLESGLGLRDLARRLGVSSTYLSRVENGLDPAPTAARLEHLARELGVPAPLLIELAQRVSPFLGDYIAAVPEAGALFLDLAHRRLSPAQLAELQQLIDERFPARRAAAAHALPRLSELLGPDRVVLGLRGTVGDAIDLLAGRLAKAWRGDAASLAAALRPEDGEVSSAIGGGVAVVTGYHPDAGEAAALVTFAHAPRHPTPDERPLRVLLALIGPSGGLHRASRVAHVARLAARGLGEALAAVESPRQAIAKLTLLEGVRR